jgi:hypothetical protein
MFFEQVISYGNAWDRLIEYFPNEVEDIRAAADALTAANIARAQVSRSLQPYHQESGVTPARIDGCWSAAIRAKGWSEASSAVRGAAGRPIHMRGLGHVKNGISAGLIRNRELLNRWLYTLAPIATRNGHIEIPIALALLQPTYELLLPRRPSMLLAGLERTREELLALSPLAHANPFLLIGLGHEDKELEVVELESEGDNVSREVIINRSIEFPPEYHQAGLGILNYFGTVLREKYPDHNAKVRIEQDGLTVRLIIESDNGDREIIEKALQEYELVVRGETPPESLFESKAKVLELKNELRIAQVRIESQRDLIAYQGEEIASFRQVIGHALTSGKSSPICITVNPAITVNTTMAVELQQVVPILSNYVQELAALAANEPEVELRLLDLDDSLNAVSTKQTAEAVKESGGVKKLKKFLEDATSAGSSINTFLNKANDGVELVQKLARRYNDLAAWCGAPQVPSILLGKES